MPRKRRIPTRRRRGAVGDGKDVRHALRTGSCWFGDLFGSRDLDSPEADHEAIKAVWNNLRDVVLAKWIAINPGTRPWGWWRFDAPERRRPAVTESEIDYLEKLGLLFDGELDRIRAAEHELTDCV